MTKLDGNAKEQSILFRSTIVRLLKVATRKRALTISISICLVTLLFLIDEDFTFPHKKNSFAFVVLLRDRNESHEYEFAQMTLKCYCESRGIPYYLIVNDKDNTKGCEMKDYMYQRHCVLANFMKAKKHEWFVMLDADMGIINPNQTIDKFLPKDESIFVVLTNRVMNSEIMAGSYIVRNDARGRDFMMMWAKSFKVYAGRYGRDNAAVHSAIVRKYLPELEVELAKCEYWWKLAKRDCSLFLYEVCVRNLLNKHEIPGIQFLEKTHSYVRDGWLSKGKFSQDDFILHNWKQSMRDKVGVFGGWDFQFTDDAFNNLSYCKSPIEAHQLWRYKPGFTITEAENRRLLDEWVQETKAKHDRQAVFADRFNVKLVPNCHWTNRGLVFDKDLKKHKP